MASFRARLAQRPFARWVIFLALHAFALYWATGLSLAVTLGPISPALFFGLMVFVALLLVAGALSLLGTQPGDPPLPLHPPPLDEGDHRGFIGRWSGTTDPPTSQGWR